MANLLLPLVGLLGIGQLMERRWVLGWSLFAFGVLHVVYRVALLANIADTSFDMIALLALLHVVFWLAAAGGSARRVAQPGSPRSLAIAAASLCLASVLMLPGALILLASMIDGSLWIDRFLVIGVGIAAALLPAAIALISVGDHVHSSAGTHAAVWLATAAPLLGLHGAGFAYLGRWWGAAGRFVLGLVALAGASWVVLRHDGRLAELPEVLVLVGCMLLHFGLWLWHLAELADMRGETGASSA